MKKSFISRLAATSVAAVVLCHSAVMADTSSVTASVGLSDAGRLNVSVKNAKFDSVEGFLNVVVALSDETFLVPPTANVMYKTVAVDPEVGTASLQLTVPSVFKSGQYYITTVDDTNTPYQNIFGFVGSGFDSGLVTEVNGAASGAGVLSVLSGTSKFDFADTLMTSYGRGAADYVYRQKPAGGYASDGKTLIDNYIKGEAVTRLLNDNVKMGEIIRIYSPHLGTERLTQYEALSGAVKTEADSLVKKSDSLKTMSFENAFRDIVDTAGFKCAADHDVLGADYLTYAAANSISLEAYNKLSDYSKDSVFLLMEDSIKSALCMENVNSAFSAAVLQETENPSVPPSDDTTINSGNGGGGGGGGGGGVAVPPAETPIPEKETDITPPQHSNAVFGDVAGHWAEKYIEKMKEQGIISGIGNGLFAPDRSVTRAEFVKMICVMNNISGGNDTAFKDVSPEAWYYAYVNAAHSAGLVNGVSDNSFAPDSPISREDAAVIISRLAGDIAKNSAASFADAEQISDYAKDAVELLAAMGVVKGDEKGNFNPQNAISRGETAALLVRIQENAE